MELDETQVIILKREIPSLSTHNFIRFKKIEDERLLILENCIE